MEGLRSALLTVGFLRNDLLEHAANIVVVEFRIMHFVVRHCERRKDVQKREGSEEEAGRDQQLSVLGNTAYVTASKKLRPSQPIADISLKWKMSPIVVNFRPFTTNLMKGPKPSHIRWVMSADAAQGRFKHTRAVRAKCRLLFKAGVSHDALIREFKGVRSTMGKVIDNNYSTPDDEDEDLNIALKDDPTFQARLDDLNENSDQDNKSQRRRQKKKRAVQRAMPAKQDEDLVGEMHRPIIIRSESPPVNQATPPPEPQDFLATFLTQISLKVLYTPLKNIGVDKDGLYRMARYEEDRLDSFMVKLGKLVPEMTPFIRLTLSDEIKRLAKEPVMVD
ncbi:hypothetical protein DFH09DRAFT_1080895 [Mycena vulgaris]|nr:hypothetical protein DFH09DRAFT_1080895 [Mycena vulgaris]